MQIQISALGLKKEEQTFVESFLSEKKEHLLKFLRTFRRDGDPFLLRVWLEKILHRNEYTLHFRIHLPHRDLEYRNHGKNLPSLLKESYHNFERIIAEETHFLKTRGRAERRHSPSSLKDTLLFLSTLSLSREEILSEIRKKWEEEWGSFVKLAEKEVRYREEVGDLPSRYLSPEEVVAESFLKGITFLKEGGEIEDPHRWLKREIQHLIEEKTKRFHQERSFLLPQAEEEK